MTQFIAHLFLLSAFSFHFSLAATADKAVTNSCRMKSPTSVSLSGSGGYKLLEMASRADANGQRLALVADNSGQRQIVAANTIPGLEKLQLRCLPISNSILGNRLSELLNQAREVLNNLMGKSIAKLEKKEPKQLAICVAQYEKLTEIKLKADSLEKYKLAGDCKLRLYGQVLQMDKAPANYHQIFFGSEESPPKGQQPDVGQYVAKDCNGLNVFIEPEDLDAKSQGKFLQQKFVCFSNPDGLDSFKSDMPIIDGPVELEKEISI